MILLSVVLIVGQVWLDLTMPDYMSEITRLVQTEGSAMADIWANGGMMLLCALGSMVLSVATGYLAARIAASFSMRLRRDIFHQVEDFSKAEINRFSNRQPDYPYYQRCEPSADAGGDGAAADHQSTHYGCVGHYQNSIQQLAVDSGYLWRGCGGATADFGGSGLCHAPIQAHPNPDGQLEPGHPGESNRSAGCAGLQRRRVSEEKFRQANDALTSNNLSANRVMAIMLPGMGLVMNGLSLAIYWIGAFLIDGVAVTNQAAAMERLSLFSDMVVFTTYAMQVVMSFMMLVMIYIMWPRVAVSARRILEVLDTKTSLADGGKTQGLPGLQGEVEFRDVSFRYPDAGGNVIEHVNFRAKQGQTVAFIGATGSGKSTLVNLVPRFYDVTEGQVLVDGVDVREYDQAALHEKLGYVPQRAVLFSGTVSSNVTYGCPDAPQEQVRKAVEIAQAADFVNNIGYAGPVAQAGSNLSGGQKQRLSIARAVCRQPEIYIFDDSFSALDYRTDRELRQALKEQTAGVTSLIVAQRIGTIRDADLILVLDQGKVVGQGTHSQLLKTCPVYRQIALSQLSKEELEHA